ncbi:MAG: hypothetical protein IV094_16525 [Vitreoscilla sp.]|nr:hypothetical protein [Vitreoscilla sp.]
MGSTLRALCVWLVMLALPFQGMAAASLRHCGPAHEAPAPAAVAAGHDHAQHHHASESSPSKPGHGAQAVAAKAGSCSACAACCAAAAPPASLPLLAEPALAGFEPPALQVSVLPFLTTGLERPPRAHLA